MLKTDEEEANDIQKEAEFWEQYDGKTDCFGTVAKLILLAAIVVQSVWQLVA